MLELIPLSYLLTTITLVILLGKLFSIWRGQLELFLYIVAVLVTTLWGTASFLHFSELAFGHYIANTLDLLRVMAWIVFLFHMTKNLSGTSYPTLISHSQSPIVFFIAGILISFSTIYYDALPQSTEIYRYTFYTHVLGHIALLISGLLLIKTCLSHRKQTQSNSIHTILIIVCALFLVDIVYYSFTLITQISTGLISLRAMATICLAIALIVVTHKVSWSKSVCVSHNTANRLILFILTLLYLSGSGVLIYIIQQYSQEWGAVTVTITSIGAALMYVSVFSSERRRSQLKVFLNKHFFNFKYDYRDEWLRFTNTLSRGGAGAHLLETVIEALSTIVASRGGMLWLSSENGDYNLASTLGMPQPDHTQEAKNSSLIVFLKQWQWIINIDEYKNDPELYQDLQFPSWLRDNPNAWLIVPLMQDVELLGFVVIPHPEVKHPINWEDHDLLKTAGRQAATHLAQLMTVQALIEAREFQAFSKLSAFVIHDLKNLVAQLSLVVSNAAKHKHNPEFMDDAIKTVDHSVSKMNRLLSQLRQGRATPSQPQENDRLNLNEITSSVIKERHIQEPKPNYQENNQEVFILANRDRMASVLEHIIQNAQEATPPDGWVKVTLQCIDNFAVIEISDNGCGMDQAFVRTRLFRPFDTTKGQGGMGIGVYESREYIRELKGDIQVTSKPGEGTTFTISLPIT